jgi:hypothetical protein
MATATSVHKQQSVNEFELKSLAEDIFELAETQLSKMSSEERKSVIASIHATAESLRAEK